MSFPDLTPIFCSNLNSLYSFLALHVPAKMPSLPFPYKSLSPGDQVPLYPALQTRAPSRAQDQQKSHSAISSESHSGLRRPLHASASLSSTEFSWQHPSTLINIKSVIAPLFVAPWLKPLYQVKVELLAGKSKEPVKGSEQDEKKGK